MTTEQLMNNAVYSAFRELIDHLTPEAWEDLPQYVQNSVLEAQNAIAAYNTEIDAIIAP